MERCLIRESSPGRRAEGKRSTFSLRVDPYDHSVALVFFGFNAVLKGYLVIRSTFLPRVLGWLSVAGGIGWLAFLSPPLGGNRLFPYIGGRR